LFTAKLRASSVGGISSFYKSFLEKDAEAHSAAVSATLAASTSKPSDPNNLTIVKPKGPIQGPTLPPPTSDAALAAEAKAKGLTVETNDSGEIVDSRDLLTPGLNFMPKKQPPPSVLGVGGSSSGGGAGGAGGASRRVGAAAGSREIRERQERMMASQLEEEEKRLEREREEREQKRIVGVKEKRNDEVAVGSARERFLERKRAKLEEEEKAKKEAAEAAAAASAP